MRRRSNSKKLTTVRIASCSCDGDVHCTYHPRAGSAALEKQRKESSSAVAQLLKQHPWIEKEKQCFGQAGTTFEFKKGDPSQDPKKMRSRLEALQEAQEKLSKNVNMKVGLPFVECLLDGA